MKELPIPSGGCWYQENGKVTTRLLVESYSMKEFFNVHKWRKIFPPKVTWDVEWFFVLPSVLRLHPVNDPSYPLSWDVQFSMDDGNYLCNKNQVWTLKLFYPKNYPYAQPVASLLDDEGRSLYGDKNRGTVTIEDIGYLLHDCLYAEHYHDPGKHHAAIYAARSILWLRSCLYSRKHGVPMPFYV